MFKLVKILGVIAVLFATVDRASALSFTATASSEEYSITNNGILTITGFTLFDDSSNTTVFTTSGFSLATGASFSELIPVLIPGDQYRTFLGLSGPGGNTNVTESVSAVPLPAGFPLFAMALLALASLAYFGSRNGSGAGVRGIAA
jgi:hypothetical protein